MNVFFNMKIFKFILPAKSFIPISYKNEKFRENILKNSPTQPPTASNVFKFLFTLFQALNRSKNPSQSKRNG